MNSEIDYIESRNGKKIYTGESFDDIRDDDVRWSKMKNIIELTEWFFNGSPSAPNQDLVVKICDKLSEEFGLTVSVNVLRYNRDEKELTLRGISIEEDIEIDEKYAEARQYIVDKFQKLPCYEVELSGEIMKVAS